MRIKDNEFLKFIRSLQCIRCGALNPDPHHVGDGVHTKRFDDRFCIPLCRKCHTDLHDGKFSYNKKHIIWKAEEFYRAYLQGGSDEFEIAKRL